MEEDDSGDGKRSPPPTSNEGSALKKGRKDEEVIRSEVLGLREGGDEVLQELLYDYLAKKVDVAQMRARARGSDIVDREDVEAHIPRAPPRPVEVIMVFLHCPLPAVPLSQFLEGGWECCPQCITVEEVKHHLRNDTDMNGCLVCGSLVLGELCGACKSNLEKHQNYVGIFCDGCDTLSTLEKRPLCSHCNEELLDPRGFLDMVEKRAAVARQIVQYLPDFILDEVDIHHAAQVHSIGESDVRVCIPSAVDATVKFVLETTLDEESDEDEEKEFLELYQEKKITLRCSDRLDPEPLKMLQELPLARAVTLERAARATPPVLGHVVQSDGLKQCLTSMDTLTLVWSLLDVPLALLVLDALPKCNLQQRNRLHSILLDMDDATVRGALGMDFPQARLDMLWRVVSTGRTALAVRLHNAETANASARNALGKLTEIQTRYGAKAVIWIVACILPTSYSRDTVVPPWVGVPPAEQAEFLTGTWKVCDWVRQAAFGIGLRQLVAESEFHRRRQWMALIGALASTRDEEKERRIEPPGADFYLFVQGYKDGVTVLVDVVHPPSGQRKDKRELPLSALTTGENLVKWASTVLGIPCMCDLWQKKEGNSIREQVVEIMTKLGLEKAAVRPTITIYGKQRAQKTKGIFVFSPHCVFDMETQTQWAGVESHLDLEPLMSAPIPLRPMRFSEEGERQDGSAVKAWVARWMARFREIHLAELVVGIAYCALCMNRDTERPTLLLAGRSDNGKTALMRFLAEMCGFDGEEALLAKITEADLWERLHFLSGLPIFCNDPKAKSQGTLTVLLDAVIPVYDASVSGKFGKQRRANGFLIAALNDKSDSKNGRDGPLESLLKLESETNRFVLCPVRQIPAGQLVGADTDWPMPPPSSTQLVQELLSIPRPENLQPTGVGGRVGRQLDALRYYVACIAGLAGLSGEQTKGIDDFVVNDMVQIARKLQSPAKTEEEEEEDDPVAAQGPQGPIIDSIIPGQGVLTVNGKEHTVDLHRIVMDDQSFWLLVQVKAAAKATKATSLLASLEEFSRHKGILNGAVSVPKSNPKWEELKKAFKTLKNAKSAVLIWVDDKKLIDLGLRPLATLNI